MKHSFVILLFLVIGLISCKKSGGSAPAAGYTAISINPEAIIVPKSITVKVKVYGTPFSGGALEDITTQASCSTSQPVATIDSNGNLANSYTGSSVQRLNLTCAYDGMSVMVPVTIVPANLTSLIITKTALTMVPGSTTSVQVYGNFTDANSYVFALDMTNYITWSSSNASVSSAVVSTLSAGSAGSATLTATFNAISASTNVTVDGAATTTSYTPKGVGLLGSYYDFATGVPWSASTIGDPFETLFGQRIDAQVNFDWSTGTNNLGQPLYFGIRWTGRIYIPTTGNYTFYTQTDDGVRLWIGDTSGAPVIDNWTLHASFENASTAISLTGGQYYDVKMEYFENAGYSLAQLKWAGPSIAKQFIPQNYLFPQ